MLLDLEENPGDKGEDTWGWDVFRCLNMDGCERLFKRACRVASVIESVETEVTELCRLLLLMDVAELLGVSELLFMDG